MNKPLPSLKSASIALVAAALLTGCATTTVEHRTKANYNEFTDVTWRPETSVRPPFHSTEIAIDAVQTLEKGIHAFYETHRSFFEIKPAADGSWTAVESVQAAGNRCFTWGRGASKLVRNGTLMTNEGPLRVTQMSDGRLLLSNTGKAAFNLALQLRAFDISGKPIRQFMRNGNNQPDALAWFVSADAKFPAGSVAYLATYWLGDDEIVMPSNSAFTGATTLEKLLARYTPKATPFCLSYVNHSEVIPYGVSFERPQGVKSRRPAAEGRFTLSPVQRSSMLCEKADSGEVKGGRWRITNIQGTRVLELLADDDVQSADIGVQPVNDEGVDVGFAEIKKPVGKKLVRQVVPVRIVRNNQAVTDFRLKFNAAAAEALAAALPSAEASRRAYLQETAPK